MGLLYNRARMTVSGTPGTGTITLLAATSAAFFTFAEAGVPNGAVVSYVIEDGSDVELGLGTYTSSGTTLARTTVTASKISGVAGTTKLTLTSAAIVYIDALAGDIIQPPTGTVTDNAIVRWDGTNALAVQGYTSGSPTISDTGVVAITNTTNANSMATGSLQTLGGIGSAGDIWALGITTGSAGTATLAGGSLLINEVNAGIEIGKKSSANTPFIDFNSSGNASIDYDVRLIASGGTASDGNGTLTMSGTGSKLVLQGTTASSAYNTGALTVAGGVGIAGSFNSLGAANSFGPAGPLGTRTVTLSFGGQPTFAFHSTTGSASNKTLGLLYDSGSALGVPGLVIQNLDDAGAFVSNSSVLWRHGGITTGGITDPGAGNLKVGGTTNAISATTGALVVGGGIGAGGDIYIGQNVDATIGITSANSNTGASAMSRVTLNSGTGAQLIMDARSSGSCFNSAITGDYFIGSAGSYRVKFFTNNSTRLSIHPSLGYVGVGTNADGADRYFHVEVDDATNNAVTYVERLTHTTSGTPASGIGVGLEFEVETAASNNEVGSTIESVVSVGTANAEIITLNGKQMAVPFAGGNSALGEWFGISFLMRSLTANVAYTNNASVQNWFSTNGACGVEAATGYEFEGILYVGTTAATTAHTISTSFGGSATLTSIGYVAEAIHAVINTTVSAATAALVNCTAVNQAAATVVTATSGTTSALVTTIKVRGIVRINGGGTFTPQWTMSAGRGAGNVLANSFFKMRRIGSNTLAAQGSWS